ncbi:MAG TPA: BfmA/BtgA family mobilization protein [Gelidibacter sp.]|uniref:BfmA/BtgA family mobilization protein n=1 Tax=Gelidibacter sp. TaxID=2018083 RepID=UPI002BC4DD3C|nr:BfmA/BtgA family mobilization protein [Gelidibacter sp.]HTO16404.1 BfmA/BtgA family mobilization protein [Edaphocola sp.]HXJ98335.1 BfmA/BtgA family mobilization protein [Gelidibacter sp.]
MKENKYTTVTITQGDNEKLTRFCRANDISKKEFITLSLSYFEREGINPKSHESPKSEIEKVIKRLDHFFAFFKKQEQEFIKPLVLDFAEEKQRRDKINGSMVGNQTMIYKRIDEKSKEINKKVESEAQQHKLMMTQQQKDREEKQEELKKAIQMLAQHMDEKNKSGLLNKLFK